MFSRWVLPFLVGCQHPVGSNGGLTLIWIAPVRLEARADLVACP